MNRSTKTLFMQSLAAACTIWVAISANAVALSGIQLRSALGQPLKAEIEVTGLDAEEFARVVARVASPDDYLAAKLAYVPQLRQLRIDADRRADGKMFLKISGNPPINEPSLELLVEFNWRGGRLLQKYSLLLDPPK
jgi:pilus assembly protein FimV